MTESSFAENAYPLPRYPVHSALLRVYSAFDDVSITLDQQEMGEKPYPSGLNVVVFDPVTDHPLYHTCFDITDPQNEQVFRDLIEKITENQLIALASPQINFLSFSQTTKTALATFGSRILEQGGFQGSWSLIGRKNAVISQTFEEFSEEKAGKSQVNLEIYQKSSDFPYPTLRINQATHFQLDEQPLYFSQEGEMKVMIFDELTGIPLIIRALKIFDRDEATFCHLIDNLPHGRGIAIALKGKPDQTLSSDVKRMGLQVGSHLIEKYETGASWVMVGYKGTPSGSAIENLHPTDANALILKVWLSPTLSPSAYWQPPQKLYAPNYHSDDAFGSALAIEDETALMAAPLSDTAIERNVGAVYLFEFRMGQWQHEQTLRPHDVEYQVIFGKAVAIENDNILIGAYLADAGWKISAGAVYSFQKWGETWQQSQKLQPYDLHPEDCFGCAIALEGDTALVGAYNSLNLLRQPTGAVYVLGNTLSGWQDKQKLNPEDLKKGDCFGHSVAISGDFAGVGAYLAEETGVVYVFQRHKGIWLEYQKLQHPKLRKGDCFGYSVALQGDVLLIGAKNVCSRGKIGIGAVYVYHRMAGQWQWVQTWQPSDLRGYEHFGHSVALSGNLAIVGADQGSSATGAYTGAVYTFQRTAKTWQPYLKLYSISGAVGDRFGYAVAIKDNLVLVGAPSAEAFGRKGAGIVYPGHFS